MQVSSCDQLLKSSPEIVLHRQLVEQLTKTYGLSELEAAQEVHRLVEKKLIPVEDSFFVEYRTYTIKDTFEKRQARLQRRWLSAIEVEALLCYNQERKELESQSFVEKRKEKEVIYSRRQRQHQKQEGGLGL